MQSKRFALLMRFFLVALLAAILSIPIGCAPTLNGTYVGAPGNSVFDKIELQAGGKVIVTLVGIAYEATYETHGSTVVVKNRGQSHELKIDSDGCLVDALGGRYCKGKAGTPKTAASANPSPSLFSGGAAKGTYVAQGPNGSSMTIVFLNATEFSLDVSMPGMKNSVHGTYQTQGTHLLLRVDQDTQVLDLARSGNTLEGKIDQDVLKFVKK